MAKELILIPKLKYERLLRNCENTCDTPKIPTGESTSKIDETNRNETSSKTDLQSGSGYVIRRKTVGKPPGLLNPSKKKKKKNIPWLSY